MFNSTMVLGKRGSEVWLWSAEHRHVREPDEITQAAPARMIRRHGPPFLPRHLDE